MVLGWDSFDNPFFMVHKKIVNIRSRIIKICMEEFKNYRKKKMKITVNMLYWYFQKLSITGIHGVNISEEWSYVRILQTDAVACGPISCIRKTFFSKSNKSIEQLCCSFLIR